MSRLLTLAVLAAACDTNPEPPPGSTPMTEPARTHERRVEERPAPEAEPEPELPPGHPPRPTTEEATHGPVPTARPEAGGLTWDAPAPFARRAPSMEMRAAEYTVAGAEGEEPAVLTVYHFAGAGGSVDDNLSRWRDQMETTGEPVIDRREVNDLRVAVIDMTGSMSAMRMPGMPPAPARSGQRFLGAIVEGPQGLVFFKMVGPEAVVATASDPFRRLLETVRPTG